MKDWDACSGCERNEKLAKSLQAEVERLRAELARARETLLRGKEWATRIQASEFCPVPFAEAISPDDGWLSRKLNEVKMEAWDEASKRFKRRKMSKEAA